MLSMKLIGRPIRPLTPEEKAIILEYLTSDLSYQEVAEKHDMTKDALRYKVGKYRKEQEKNGKKDNQ